MSNNRVHGDIIRVYRDQLKEFKRLSVFDDEGNFMLGGTTRHGTKVTETLIKATQRRLSELTNKNLKGSDLIIDENNKSTETK
mgnify:FL=1|tara:strand:+ start:221 stop:469 length:249 start_codon:yes stop_codon:yes gene_type:complete